MGNFRSFKEKATLSLEASPDDWLEDSHVIATAERRLLKSAAIYGANASGKTNLLAGMEIFRQFIQKSSRESQIGEKIPVAPFRLHTATEKAPTYFEMVFLQKGTRYRYGFEATPETIHAEWLFSQRDSIRETRLFTREGVTIEPSAEFREGKGLETRTRPNALFLSVVSQFNGAIAGEIMQWMERFRGISGSEDANYLAFTKQLLKDAQFGAKIRDLIRRADVGIEDLQAFEVSVSERLKSLPKDFPEHLRQEVLAAPSAFTIKTLHKKFGEENQACEKVEFNFKSEESAGTQKFVAMSGPFLHTLEEGSILFVDELEARFHPLLTKSLVGLFNDPRNQMNAQLIYATHDEGLLDSARIRRDQVWFVEKDEIGASRLFSLAEFKVRKEAKFAKEYLLGQFGAVPHLRDLSGALTNAK
ncbi:MAG: AAA family ATPase [Limisphaerales bacterium]